MNLAFLDHEVLFIWTVAEVAKCVGRHTTEAIQTRLESVRTMVAWCRDAGAVPAATIHAACNVVTEFYKSRALPYKGEVAGFPVRKSLAREAASLLRSQVCLLSPTTKHFEHAERLWLRWCMREAKEGYAQFADYVDAALVLSPPAEHAVPAVLVAHPHVHYILRKEKATATSYVIT